MTSTAIRPPEPRPFASSSYHGLQHHSSVTASGSRLPTLGGGSTHSPGSGGGGGAGRPQNASAIDADHHHARLVKKASKPILGWLTRKLRRGTLGPGGQLGSPPPPLPQGRHSTAAAGVSVSSKARAAVGANDALKMARSQTGESPGRAPQRRLTEPAPDTGGMSEYGRLVASNGVALMRGLDLRRQSEFAEDEDSRSIATSLDPFAPSFRASITEASHQSHQSYGSTFHSGYSHSFVRSRASSVASSTTIDSFADEDASLRPIAPSVPPSPTHSYPTTTTSGSTANSLRYASSGTSRNWRSIAGATATTATTSIESRSSGDTGGGGGGGPPVVMAHIAQVPPDQQMAQQIGPLPQQQQHNHRTFNPFSLSQHAAAQHPRSVAPASPSSTNGLLRWTSSSGPQHGRHSGRDSLYSVASSTNYSIAVPGPSMGAAAAAAAGASSPNHPHHASPTTAVSFSFSQSSVPASTVVQPVHIPLQTISPPSSPNALATSLPSSFSAGGGSGQAPPHRVPHPKNNPIPSAAPPDNASLLTLASSSFFSFPPGSSSNSGAGGVSGGGGGGGPGSTHLNTTGGGSRGGGGGSIRRGMGGSGGGAAESISFSLFGGRPPSGSRRRSFDTSGGGGLLGRLDGDGQASVRAVRRKGSWESGESRWSAAPAINGAGGPTTSSVYGGHRGGMRESVWAAGGGGGGPSLLAGGGRSFVSWEGGGRWGSYSRSRRSSMDEDEMDERRSQDDHEDERDDEEDGEDERGRAFLERRIETEQGRRREAVPEVGVNAWEDEHVRCSPSPSPGLTSVLAPPPA